MHNIPFECVGRAARQRPELFGWFRKTAGLAALLGAFFCCGCGKNADAFLFMDEAAETTEETARETDGAAEQELAKAPTEGAKQEAAEREEETAQDEPAVCVVHICGAVAEPGVYELPEGSRVMDAVKAGGGFLEDADPAACNLAQPVIDGCQIYIMTKEESSSLEETGRQAGIVPAGNELTADGVLDRAGSDLAAPEDSAGKVNLNTADAAALKTLPGIGDSRAAAIIAWRQENGRFTCIEDVMKVSGIKQAAFEKIKDRITV